jgi:hypothetical protein
MCWEEEPDDGMGIVAGGCLVFVLGPVILCLVCGWQPVVLVGAGVLLLGIAARGHI